MTCRKNISLAIDLHGLEKVICILVTGQEQCPSPMSSGLYCFCEGDRYVLRYPEEDFQKQQEILTLLQSQRDGWAEEGLH